MASVPFCKSHKSSLDTFSEKFDQAVGKNILSSEKVDIFYKPFAHFKFFDRKLAYLYGLRCKILLT